MHEVHCLCVSLNELCSCQRLDGLVDEGPLEVLQKGSVSGNHGFVSTEEIRKQSQ